MTLLISLLANVVLVLLLVLKETKPKYKELVPNGYKDEELGTVTYDARLVTEKAEYLLEIEDYYEEGYEDITVYKDAKIVLTDWKNHV